MRTAVSAMRAFYGLHLGRDWKLFDLVRSPSAKKLPTVLTREEVARFFSVLREPRFKTVFRLIYACGLRISYMMPCSASFGKRRPESDCKISSLRAAPRLRHPFP